jgi:ElaB/YqjD/DUF883 family membrane-anchored ribosome-binding protein
MNHFAEKMEEFLKEAASDAVKDQVSDAIDDIRSDFESEVEDAKYSMEQTIDSAISDVKDDITSEVMSDIDSVIDDRIDKQVNEWKDSIAIDVYNMLDLKGAINECLESHKAINPPLNSDDMRWIKDCIDAIVKERIAMILDELAKFARPTYIPNK